MLDELDEPDPGDEGKHQQDGGQQHQSVVTPPRQRRREGEAEYKLLLPDRIQAPIPDAVLGGGSPALPPWAKREQQQHLAIVAYSPPGEVLLGPARRWDGGGGLAAVQPAPPPAGPGE